MKALRSIVAVSAVAVFAMTSCTADEQISQNTTDGAIRFSVNTANQTRAAHSYCANEMPAYFNVYADYATIKEDGSADESSRKLYIDGDKITRVGESNSTNYVAEENRYWPESNYSFNFYAYADDGGSFVYKKNSDGTFSYKFEDFTVESDVANQLDLMYATEIGKQQSDNKYGTVDLNFRHALSQICYKAKNENPNIEITVNSITISGVDGKGTYIFPTESTTGHYENHTDTPEESKPTLNHGDWDATSEPTSYEVSLNKVLNAAGTETSLTTFSKNESDENSDDSHKQTGEYKTYSNALNLIPQYRSMASVAEASTTPTNGAYFTLNLTIKNNLNKSENQVGEKTTIVANKDFYVAADINWTQGNRYIYTFNFAKDWQGLTPITYTVNVDDFITGEEIELPRNVIKGTTNSSDAFHISVNGSTKNVTPDGTRNSEDTYNFYVDLGPDELESLKFTDCTTITSLDLSGVDTRKVKDMISMFEGCCSLTTLDMSNFNTSSVTYMPWMFEDCSSLTTLDLSNFDTSSVTDMSGMFECCSSLTTLYVSNFDTSSVRDMSGMFEDCSSLTTLDMSNFNTSKVTNMCSMFKGCSSLTTLVMSNFNTSKVTNMSSTFEDCSSLTELDLSNFNTSKVTNMSDMFAGCSSLTTLNMTNFNTSNVTYMCRMFHNCSSLTELDLSNFNTSAVTNMSWMFVNCSSLTTLDVSKFDTSSVTDMSWMFYNCSSLTTLDLSEFDTSNVEYMSNMFYGCSGLATLNLSKFDTSNVENMSNMFYGCSGLATLDLSGFQANSKLKGESMFKSDSTVKITTNEDFKEWLLNNKIVTSKNFTDSKDSTNPTV